MDDDVEDIVNVLTKYKTEYEAVEIYAETLGLKAEHVGIRLLARMVLEAGNDMSVTMLDREGVREVIDLRDLLPVTGGQFDETFDVHISYGEMYPDMPHYYMMWENEVAGAASVELECDSNAAVVAAIILQGRAIMKRAKILIFE